MHFSRVFIERPIMTTLVTFAILLFGIVGFRALPISALPSVDYPTIQVTAAQPGANPETMASSIATPLERAFSTIAGLRSMSSSNVQGVTTITMQFALDRDIDAAAQDVQASIAQAILPPMPRPPSYAKQNPSEQPILYLALTSNTLPLYTVNEYAETMLAQRISSVSGVSRVQIFGAQKYAVRIQVDPDRLAALPPSVELLSLYDASESVRGSIHDVEFTLMLTIALVVMVIFLFLRNLSATLIPGSAVVLSIVGTFATMYLLGYSLNILSLMALTLSVGFVVDDAIAMLENIVRYMEMGKGRCEAAMLASKEIGFTIVSMTLSLVAVFIPVLFLGGMVGRLLHQFSVTIIVAILISGFVSLTFTPMLGSRYLPSQNLRHGLLYVALEKGFEAVRQLYDYTLRKVLRHSFATMAVALAMLAGTIYVFRTMPTGFIPSQDSGFVFGVSMAGQDISYESMAQRQKAVAEVVQADPNVAGTAAFSLESNVGYVFATMKPRNQRQLSVDE